MQSGNETMKPLPCLSNYTLLLSPLCGRSVQVKTYAGGRGCVDFLQEVGPGTQLAQASLPDTVYLNPVSPHRTPVFTFADR